MDINAFFNKQLLYKQDSTRQGKKLSNFSTGLKTATQFEKFDKFDEVRFLKEN